MVAELNAGLLILGKGTEQRIGIRTSRIERVAVVKRIEIKFDIRLNSYELPTPRILTAFQPGDLHGSLSAQGLVRISGNFELADGIWVTAGGWISRFELFITFTKKVENVGQRKIHFVPKPVVNTR